MTSARILLFDHNKNLALQHIRTMIIIYGTTTALADADNEQTLPDWLAARDMNFC